MKEFIAQKNIAAGAIELFFFERLPGGTRVGKPIQTAEIENDGTAYADSFARINKTEAQVLMDSLWDCGIRPTEGQGSACAMAAQTKHLEDMRTIAFRTLKFPKP